MCSFEVRTGHGGGFRRRDELRDEFRGKAEGGEEGITGKGLQAI